MENKNQSSKSKPHPFISYGREDQDFVRMLDDALSCLGCLAWVDWDITPTSLWMQEIEHAIDEASAIIVIISPNSVTSSVCRDEIEYALAQSKRLIPVEYRKVNPQHVHDSLRKLNWVVATDVSTIADLAQQLVSAMETDLVWIQEHSRLLVRAREWESRKRDKSLLLVGNDLKKSEQWLVDVGDSRQARRPTPLQTQYVFASRTMQSTHQRYTLVAITCALAVTITLAIYAIGQSRIAVEQKKTAVTQRNFALSRMLAARASENTHGLSKQMEAALLQSVLANQIQPTAEANRSLYRALTVTNRVDKFLRTEETLVSLALSPDGHTIATGDFNGGIMLWNVDTLTRQSVLWETGPMPRVIHGLAFSPDSKTLAVITTNGITLWDVSSKIPKNLQTWDVTDGRSIIWHPSGKRLITDNHNEVVIWDVATGKPQNVFVAHKRPLQSLAMTADGKLLATAGFWDNRIKLWDLETGQALATLQGHHSYIRALAFNPDGTLLASGGEDFDRIIWDVATKTERIRLSGGALRVDCLAFSPDGKRLAVGGNNRAIELWDSETGKHVETLFGHLNGLMNVIFNRDGTQLFSNAFDRTWIAWNLGMPQYNSSIAVHATDVELVAVSSDGSLFASSSKDGVISIWNSLIGQEVIQFETKQELQTIAIDLEGQVLATGSHERGVGLWDLSTGVKLQTLGDRHDIVALAFNPDDGSLASASSQSREIHIWDVKARKLKGVLLDLDRPENLSFNSGGDILVSGGRTYGITIWGAKIGTSIGMITEIGPTAVAISPDGSRVAGFDQVSGLVMVWATHNQEKFLELDVGLPFSDNILTFSRDGNLLAHSSGEFGTDVVIWDVDKNALHGILETPSTTQSFAFARDRRLLTGHVGGNVLLWDADFERWLNRACEITSRDFTQEEWKTQVSEDLPYRAVCLDRPLTP